MAHPLASDYPHIVYNSKTLYLPGKFVDWKLNKSHNPSITKGLTYTQVVSQPVLYDFTAKTKPWRNTSLAWVEGDAADQFLDLWDTFFNSWASLGKVFAFYRVGSVTSESRKDFPYCVWSGDNDGVELLMGHERYQLTLKIQTEGAAR